MRALKIIGIGFAILIALVLIVALFVPKEFTYEKTIAINAPIDSVWPNTGSLTAMDKWSPWNDHDPNMKKKFTGVDGTVGAKQSWDGKVVGVGSQTITNVQKPTLFETSLDFKTPRESHGKGYVKLLADGNTTKATWGMSGGMPYPFNIMILFMNMEKSMGKDWDLGLSRLKKLSEK
ncbi:MAG: SRPBCC family protein [Paludibacter sp.]|jgi:Polyketide cyclase / dehydrase and lipid transport